MYPFKIYKSIAMKTIIKATIIIAGILIFRTVPAQVSVYVNIGVQPLWGPVGYDYVEYYYLPEIECYYYVPRRQYVYLSNGRWTFSAGCRALTLPSASTSKSDTARRSNGWF